MIYLSGAIRPELAEHGIGYMLTPMMGNSPDLSAVPWAGDNGCFAQPDKFDLAKFLAWLVARPTETCLFAVAPDVVGDAKATWTRSRFVLPVIRRLGFKAALVAQDGFNHNKIQWSAFDALFIGGSTDWKVSPYVIQTVIPEAKRRGKWVHGGRVNSYKRLRLYADAGCDSADGTFLAFGPDVNLPRLLGWLRTIERQPALVTR